MSDHEAAKALEAEALFNDLLKFMIPHRKAGAIAAITAALTAARQATWEEAAKQLEAQAAYVLSQWEHDPLVPHTTHEPKDCHDRCDGYCITQMEFSKLAEDFRQKGQVGSE
jgi:hypothetical protein